MSNPAFKFDHVHIISNDPEASANWYVEMFGATITANTTARGAPQIFVNLGGMTILIRGPRPARTPPPPDAFGHLKIFPVITHGGPIISASSTKAISRHFVPSCAAKASVSRSS